MKILNNAELDTWMEQARALDQVVIGVKGQPPEGMTYEDGAPVERPVNVAWKNVETGDVIDIIYGHQL